MMIFFLCNSFEYLIKKRKFSKIVIELSIDCALKKISSRSIDSRITFTSSWNLNIFLIYWSLTFDSVVDVTKKMSCQDSWLKIKSSISIRSSDLTVQNFLTRNFLLRISRINSIRIVVSLYTSWLHSLRARSTFFYHTIVHQSHSINSSQSIRAIVR